MSAGSQIQSIKPTRGGALDALRFVAAACVLLYHARTFAPVDLDLIHPAFARGYLASDFFLMLSGFVLARSYGQRVLQGGLGTGAFLKRRVQRLWPAHLIVLAAFALVIGGATLAGLTPNHPERFQWAALPQQIFLIHAWGLPGGQSWNTPTWTLSALLVCYAVFPWVWRTLSHVRSSEAALAMTVGLALATDLACQATTGRALWDLPIPMGVIRALPLFMVGLGLARVAEPGSLSRGLSRALGLGSLALLIALQFAGRFDVASLACIGALIVACNAGPVGRPWPLAAAAARVSFALFITHAFSGLIWQEAIQNRMAHTHAPMALQWAVWGGRLVFSLMVAIAFERFVDAPVQRLLARRVSPRPSLRPATAPSG